MPWHVEPRGDEFCVIKDEDNSQVACHPTRAAALAQVAALYANESVDVWEATFTAQQRRDLARSGAAMPDGSFPIRNASDLSNAIQALGRASNPAAAKRHIIKRARALGLTDQLPDSWSESEGEDMPVTEGVGSFVKPVAEADAAEPDGSVWEVVIIKVGKSLNGRRYRESVLRQAAPLFEGARVLARSDNEHVNGEGVSVTNVVGWIDGVFFERRALRGMMHLLDEGIKGKLIEAWRQGKRDLMGLSIAADGEGRTITEGGESVQDVESITKVGSVDLVMNPAAGGGLLRLVASEGRKEEPMLQKLIEKLREAKAEDIPKLIKGVAESLGYSFDEVKKLVTDEEPGLTEALQNVKEPDPPAPAAASAPVQAAEAVAAGGAPAPKAEPEDEDLVSVGTSRVVVRMELSETKLPDIVKDKLANRFAGKAFRYQELTEAIADEVDTWSKLEKTSLQSSAGSTRDVEVGREEIETAIAKLTGFFAEADVELDGQRIPRWVSIREAYVALTGDESFTGRLPEKKSGMLGLSRRNAGLVETPIVESEYKPDGSISMKLVEALATTSWTEILGDSVTRVMLREYRAAGLDDWRLLADVVPARDFRTQRRMRFGGYGDLPAVNQAAAYAALTSPADEEATYAVTKRGGTETISLEAITNDDVGAIRRIPTRLARAAARTLYKFVFDFIRTNGNIYDGVAFFHATHGGNLLATALSQASLTSARVAMFEQTDMSTNEQLGLSPRHLWVPIELEQLAYELTRSEQKPGSADNDINYTRQLGFEAHTVLYWTDATDWAVTADKADVPIIEVAFFGGEEPELITQDMPNVGSMFTNDQVTIKIRHIYGGAVMDFRGAVKSVQ